MERNPQNNLPEPLGTIVILANFCFGLWNVYSNLRQEKSQSIYKNRQDEILSILRDLKSEMEGSEIENAD